MSDTPKIIYLIHESEHEYVWCEDPAPGVDMEPEDAVAYILKSEHDILTKQVETLRGALAKVDELNGGKCDVGDECPGCQIDTTVKQALKETA